MPKARRTITLDRKILEWTEEQIKEKRFASLSHAVEFALNKLIKEEKAL